MQKKKTNNYKILLTGGHAGATAYAVIQEIRKQNKKWDLCWVGSKVALEGKKVEPLEIKVFPEMGVKTYGLTFGRLQRRFTRWTIPSLLKIPIGFVQTVFILKKINPDVILSFGGYASFSVVVLSWIMGKSVIIHEQTSEAGRANIYSSFFSKKIAISRITSRKYFPQEKTVLIGNPVEPEILKIKPKDTIGEPATILIAGGHTGSVIINYVVEQILKEILNDFKVIHQTGDYQFEKFKEIRNSLDSSIKNKYFVYGTVMPQDWPHLLEKSDIIISRAGANIVSQVMAIKRPAIFIPISFAYKNEQLENAYFAKKFGIAYILEEKQLNPRNLFNKIYYLKNNWKKIINIVKYKKSPDINASQKLINLISEFL